MPDTARLALPYPVGADPANIPADLQALAEALDGPVAIDDQGGIASRPAAGVRGRYYWATDQQILYRDSGSAWIIVGAARLSFGTLPGGYAAVTASQSGITTEADLTGLSVTVNVAAGRRYRIAGQGHVAAVGGSASPIGRIREGSTELNRWLRFGEGFVGPALASGQTILGTGAAILTPGASATRTFKLTLESTSGAGSAALVASSAAPAFILVEDIGPSA